ncbi:DUF1761 family protein [Candidatus Babeliales bacterium]|nr:DUF1761 family protein [Candidatus Babeliales bacterium]
MMPLNPIIAAAAADMLVGKLCYSEYAFGPMWRKLTGVKSEVSKDMYLRLAVQAVSSIMAATALYIAILTFQKAQIISSQAMFTQLYSWFFMASAQNAELMSSLKLAGFVWFGFFVPNYLSCTVWHNQIIWHKFTIKSICKLAQLLAMAAVLATLG